MRTPAFGRSGPPAVSALRARCPHCRTLTAVAFDDGYECHSCGASFAAGLVRVPRAWGVGGEAMAEAAGTQLPVARGAGRRARLARGADRTRSHAGCHARPLVLGGCCCAHVGRDPRARRPRRAHRRGLARRARRPQHAGDARRRGTSGACRSGWRSTRAAWTSPNVALVGARDLDPPEVEYVAEHGIDDDLDRALDGVAAAYVALDVDVLEPGDGRPASCRVRAGPAWRGRGDPPRGRLVGADRRARAHRSRSGARTAATARATRWPRPVF